MKFFFSSRRRHTRSLRDWSSDVCSSDLGTALVHGVVGGHCGGIDFFCISQHAPLVLELLILAGLRARSPDLLILKIPQIKLAQAILLEIGRASCRERVESSVGVEE